MKNSTTHDSALATMLVPVPDASLASWQAALWTTAMMSPVPYVPAALMPPKYKPKHRKQRS